MPSGIYLRKPYMLGKIKQMIEANRGKHRSLTIKKKISEAVKIAILEFPSRKGKVKFCSKKCYSDFMRQWQFGKNHPSWQGGKSFEEYPPTFNQQLKDRIRVRDNFICQKCGVPELECGRRLDIHHIDYDKKNCEMDNLISLCRSCNVKANGNRECYKKYFTKGVSVCQKLA